MKTNDVKKVIYDYLKEKVFAAYPDNFELMEYSRDEIFWGKLKNQAADKIYVSLIDKNISKIDKRFEQYKSDGKYYYKKRKQILVTFSVYIVATDDFYDTSDALTVDLIEFIETLFTESVDTFNYFAKRNIVINELLASDIRDVSTMSGQTQEFRKEIDIPFEYVDIREYTPELAEKLEMQVEVKGE